MEGDSFFIFRLPGEKSVTGFKSCKYTTFTEDYRPGFLIAPFDQEKYPTVHIPAETPIAIDEINSLISKPGGDLKIVSGQMFPSDSTPREEYDETIVKAIELITTRVVDKIVISRVIVGNGKVNTEATFKKLIDSYKNAYVFCFYTPVTGLWLGASPERLISYHEGNITTMALAGTLPVESSRPWDEKNLREHNIVKDYILATFKEKGLETKANPTITVEAGPVKHLQTEISGVPGSATPYPVLQIVKELSPTPALAGFPQHKTVEYISQLETYDRGYYGGFTGYVNGTGECDLFVNLRSMLMTRDRYCMFCGSGIMETSTAEEEWKETEIKAHTLLNNLQIE